MKAETATTLVMPRRLALMVAQRTSHFCLEPPLGAMLVEWMATFEFNYSSFLTHQTNTTSLLCIDNLVSLFHRGSDCNFLVAVRLVSGYCEVVEIQTKFLIFLVLGGAASFRFFTLSPCAATSLCSSSAGR